MSLSSYTGLQASVADWLNRSDLTTQIPDFIDMAEAMMNRTLRTRQMIARSYTNLTSNYLELPADYAAVKSVQLNTDPLTALSYCTPDMMIEFRRQNDSGKPKFYSIVGNYLEFSPSPDGTYQIEIVYWQRIPPLASNPTNWLLDRHPDLYLYATLLQSAPYLKDDDRIPVWSAAVQSITNDITVDNERAERSGQPLKMRIKPY